MGKPQTRFDAILRILLDGIAGIAMTGIMIVVLLQVASRLLGRPVSWTEEATRYLFVWMIFFGVAAGFRTVETARVTVFIDMMPELMRRLSVPIYVVSSVLFFALTAWTGWMLAKQQYMMNETAATLVIPMWIIGTIMPIAAILAILAIFESLRTRRRYIELPDLGLPPGQAVEADIAVPDPEQKP
ncbi:MULTISPECIES: TRAP transporter small permease [unclassified Mesorhizobium]|uniref:TRAP transporter small permease n=1 Tax=unclassified Mesorhizobium TaxID=325217 RepID=UPI000FE81BB4|nr:MULTISPECIES: TRAP transporter small permease [unclassified Mesorhizobium]RWI29196.1 MAG: TRAP transporter small permease [Mesorhizobium sp.]RWK47088.1 MAG: TRAP transporter small permease [Mesorhizobium sp.]RWK92783.1 MAG: TRAP transporter small permease [Mesorhizobium sp.]RWL11432.1 MAG: TRAP transporter small permease [Mesorhizobium sp.]TIP57911.1 MAG: TRAP transporter small permease [Mesorhizobium sp.]